VFVGGLALYFLLGLFLWWLLQRYVDPSAIKDPSKEATAKKDLLQALGLIMAGVAGAIGIYFTWRGQRITRKGLEDTQKATEEQLRLSREGQITERFTRAIDQLGESNDNEQPRLETRIGAIYALERIDKESSERVYHSTVMEVLTAYVRQNAARPPEEATPIPSKSSKGSEAEEDSGGTGTLERESPASILERATAQARRIRYIARPRADIQAILDVLRRREEQSVPDKYRVNLDLQRTKLLRAELQGINLRGANLWYAHLGEANLQGADLRRIDLRRADLSATDLHAAKLAEAKLTEAELTAANLSGANLSAALLPEAHLEGANLYNAKLQEANLQGANLSKANLQRANLSKANLQEAEVTVDQLVHAVSLQGATMTDGSVYS
jgi:uncharacterized protein YjbI with pentapeptide repeats